MIEISELEQMEAQVLYTKGNILTLWLYLTKLFKRFDEDKLYTPEAVAQNNRLISLMLCRVECNLILNALCVEFSLEEAEWIRDFWILKIIANEESIHPLYRSTAMAYQVMMTIDHFDGRVCWPEAEFEQATQPQLQTKLLGIVREALDLRNETSTENGEMLEFTLAHLRDLFGLSDTKRDAATIGCVDCTKIVDRRELYISLWKLITIKEAAIEINSSKHLWLVIDSIEYGKTLGEFGGMLVSGWWHTERLGLQGTPIWKEATEGDPFAEEVTETQTAPR